MVSNALNEGIRQATGDTIGTLNAGDYPGNKCNRLRYGRTHLKALLFDFKAMRNNGIIFPFITVVFKPLRKIMQFFQQV